MWSPVFLLYQHLVTQGYKEREKNKTYCHSFAYQLIFLLLNIVHREPLILYGVVGQGVTRGCSSMSISMLVLIQFPIRGSCLSLPLIGDHIQVAISPPGFCGILFVLSCLCARHDFTFRCFCIVLFVSRRLKICVTILMMRPVPLITTIVTDIFKVIMY